MARARRFGDLSKAARDRAARAGEEYGLNRNAVAKRYNRGTYNPLSSDPIKRLPRELQRHADEEGNVNWRELAFANIEYTLGPDSPRGETYKYNTSAVRFYTQNMSMKVARLVAMATEAELMQWASPQANRLTGEPPPIETWGLPPEYTLEHVSAYDDGQWNNIFWYH